MGMDTILFVQAHKHQKPSKIIQIQVKFRTFLENLLDAYRIPIIFLIILNHRLLKKSIISLMFGVQLHYIKKTGGQLHNLKKKRWVDPYN